VASAVPKPEPGDWLKAAADELKQGDKATLALLQESYRNVNKILKGLPDAPDAAFGDLVYRAQLERTRRALLAEQAKLFDKLGDKVAARRLRSASRAARLSAASNAALLRLVGEGAEGQRLYEGANITAQRTVETLLARAKLSAVPLAERIYNTKSWMNKRLDNLIVSTMAAGLNAQKFAKVARDWFAPSVPGGTRYAAMRLARTEINNAFHATSIVYAQDKPWVSQMDWHLSKSHPTPDKCNGIAAASPYDVHLIPRKPHPQCMCYVTEVTPDEDEWIDRFVAGEFDDYLDGKLAEADHELGIKTQQATTTSQKPQKIKPVAKPRPKSFADRLRDAATEGEALAAAPIGDGRTDNPASFTSEMKRALSRYTGSWYQQMNALLRGQAVDSEDRDLAERYSKDLDNAFANSKLKKEVLTYRGLHNAQRIFGDRLQHDLTGLEWLEEAYVSTTTIEKRTRGFVNSNQINPLLMRIVVPAGGQAIEASSTFLEAELLLGRGARLRVVQDNGVVNGIRRLDVEVLLDD
jgi:hypothetical protein